MTTHNRCFQRPMTLTATLMATLLGLSACSDGDPKNAGAPEPSKQAVGTSTPPPPSYSAEQIRAALLGPKEIGKDIRETAAEVGALETRQAPMCSYSGVALTGKPDITIRQFANSARGRDEIRYAQLVARYDDSAEAERSFAALEKAARACPPRRHVPSKKVEKNRTRLAHDDTWKVTASTVAGWRGLRGIEQQTYPPSASKFNVFHFMYDYAVRGNVVIATVYWERTEPKKSGDPIARRATELLTKQLQKFG